MKYLAFLLLLSATAAAQLRPVVYGTMGNDSELGYKTPSFTISGGAEYEAPAGLFIGSVTYGGGKKNVNGYTLNGRGEANIRIYSGLLAGAGVSCGEVVTDAYRKGACRPLLQLVLDGKVRTTVGYLFRGNDKFNELEGIYLSPLYKWTDHLRTGIDFGRYRFVDSITREPRTARTWALKLGWVF